MKAYLMTALAMLCYAINSNAEIIQTIKSGSWNSKSTWNLNRKPLKSDTIIVNLNDTLSMTADNDTCDVLKVFGTLKWASNNKKTTADEVQTFSSSRIFGTVLGDLVCSRFIVHGNTEINKLNLFVNDSLILKDSLIFSSNSGYKSIKNIFISSNGTFINSASEDFDVKNLTNNNVFEPKDGVFSFESNGSLSGISACNINQIQAIDTLNIKTKVSQSALGTFTAHSNANQNFVLRGSDTLFCEKFIINSDTLFNESNLYVYDAIKNNKVLFCKSSSSLGLGMNEVWNEAQVDFEADVNVEYFKNGNQELFNSISTYNQLTISGAGIKELKSNISVSGKLLLRNGSYLEVDDYEINHPNNINIELEKNTFLKLGLINSVKTNSLFHDVKKENCSLHKTSTVIFNNAGSPTFSSIPTYGNLTLEDGSNNTHTFSINSDTLSINGNLSINQSSTLVNLKNQTLIIEGDILGLGTIDLDNGIFESKGNFNNDGAIIGNNIIAIYSGTNKQEAKIGNFKKVTVNKPKGSPLIINAGNGSFSAEIVEVKSGSLHIGSETINIDSLIVSDSIKFVSGIQDKNFKHVIINSVGIWDNSYGENISIGGDIYNNGEFINTKGKIYFNNNLDQNISGNGVYKLDELNLNKFNSQLNIFSNLIVQDTINIISGSLNLTNSQIEFIKKGALKGESNTNKVIGQNAQIKWSGNINKTILNYNIGGLGAQISTNQILGQTKVIRYLNAPDISGYETIAKVYKIEPENDLNLNALLKVQLYQHEIQNLGSNNLIMLKSSDNGLTYLPQNSSFSTNTNEITLTGINSFSNWAFGSELGDPLSVEVSSFNYECSDDSILVKWTSYSETNSQYFYLEIDNTTVSKIMNQGNSFYPKTYTINVPKGKNGTLSLYEMDQNNKISLIKSIPLYCKNQNNALLINNMSSCKLIQLGNKEKTIVIYSSMGELLKTFNSFSNEIDLNSINHKQFIVSVISKGKKLTYNVIRP